MLCVESLAERRHTHFRSGILLMQRRFCRRLVACCLQPTHLHNSGTCRLPSVAGGSNASLLAAIRSVRQSRAESPFLPPTRGLLRAACCIFTTLAQPCFFVHLFLHIRLLGAFNSRACRGALQISGGHPCAIVVKRRESLGGAIVHILQQISNYYFKPTNGRPPSRGGGRQYPASCRGS